jgi:beta-1,4-mannosyltransferase
VTSSEPPRLVVMESFTAVRPTTNPYLTQLIASLPPTAKVLTFSWWRALRGEPDVLHVHWPEVLIRDHRVLQRLARQALFGLVLLRIRFSRMVLVRTLHNHQPHESGPHLEQLLLRLCDRYTSAWIELNDFSRPPTSAPRSVIPHGHYRNWLAPFPKFSSIEGRILYFGLIRQYKGVDELLLAFRGVSSVAELRLVGQSKSRELTDRIAAAAAADARVSADLRYLSDEALTAEVTRAQLIVLPYRYLENSGSLLFALSLGRPVLVPSNRVTEALADEVGRAWVHTYEGPLADADIERALSATPDSDSRVPPDLSAREWPTIADAHNEVFIAACEHKSQGRALKSRSVNHKIDIGLRAAPTAIDGKTRPGQRSEVWVARLSKVLSMIIDNPESCRRGKLGRLIRKR